MTNLSVQVKEHKNQTPMLNGILDLTLYQIFLFLTTLKARNFKFV